MNRSERPVFPDWDLFCRVVDNFGDIGLCWRLARALADRHGLALRLWVDDWDAFARLCPAAAAERERLVMGRIEVRRWTASAAVAEPAQVVVEAFACELPADYVAAMAARARPPVWINLEYLSAEDWVAGCHRLASPHPRLPLVKHFFFPGFTAGTGGLLREPGLLEARDDFQARPEAADGFFARFGLPPARGALTVSLFAYAQPALAALLRIWADGDRAVRLLVPDGKTVAEVAHFFGQSEVMVGSRWTHRSLSAVVLPFLDQNEYDRLLWACDLNFVRGEDSFVRAQWAARPFVWQAYPQQEDAHLAKLDAFLGRYLDGLAPSAADALRRFWATWNDGGDPLATWHPFAAALPGIAAHNRRWAERLASRDDLSTELVKFSAITVK